MNRPAVTVAVLAAFGVGLFLIGATIGFRLVDAWMAAR